jgi:hypothetical protein
MNPLLLLNTSCTTDLIDPIIDYYFTTVPNQYLKEPQNNNNPKTNAKMANDE